MSDAAQGVTYGRLIMDALTRFSDRPAFVQEGRTYTYVQAADLVGRMRAVLAGRGIALGSGVGALSPNRAEVWLAQAAAWLLGARYSGLHPLGSEDDHVFLCDDAQIEALVVDPVHAERAAAIAAGAQTIKRLHPGAGRGGGGSPRPGRASRSSAPRSRPGRRGGRGLAHLHRGHHRPAQGRDGFPPGPGPAGSVLHRLLAAARPAALPGGVPHYPRRRRAAAPHPGAGRDGAAPQGL